MREYVGGVRCKHHVWQPWGLSCCTAVTVVAPKTHIANRFGGNLPLKPASPKDLLLNLQAVRLGRAVVNGVVAQWTAAVP